MDEHLLAGSRRLLASARWPVGCPPHLLAANGQYFQHRARLDARSGPWLRPPLVGQCVLPLGHRTEVLRRGQPRSQAGE
eukprot:14712482-Alexandrium_andersonii.AAC.1